MNTRIWVLWVAGTLLPAQFVSALTPDWIRQIATPARDWAQDLAIDYQGSVYVTGYTGGSLFVANDEEYEDAYLAKFDGEGNLQWGWQWGMQYRHWTGSVVIDLNGDIYAAGSYEIQSGEDRNAIFHKFRPDGTRVWERRIVDPDGWAACNDLAVDPKGDLYFLNSPWGFGVGKYSADGDLLWNHDIEIPVDNTGETSFYVDPAGEASVTYYAWEYGNFLEHYDTNGNPLSQVELQDVRGDTFNSHPQLCADGNIYGRGVSWHTQFLEQIVDERMVLKWGPDGEIVWKTSLDKRYINIPFLSMATDSGLLYAAASVDGRFLLTALDTSDGAALWTQEWDSGEDVAFSLSDFAVASLNDGTDVLYAALRTQGDLGTPNLGDYDAYLAKFTLPRMVDGDFDHDGDVDGADLLAWQRGASPTPLSADDFAAWQTAFGAAAEPVAPIGVPEPATFALLFAAAVAALPRSRKGMRSVGGLTRGTRS